MEIIIAAAAVALPVALVLVIRHLWEQQQIRKSMRDCQWGQYERLAELQHEQWKSAQG